MSKLEVIIGNKMIYGYCRVSTKCQVKGNSLDEQNQDILNRYEGAKIIIESSSGAGERKIFNKVMETLKEGDILVCSKLDRFCRTTKEGLEYIDRLLEKGVSIHILNLGLIENTSMGRLIVTCLLAFAEFERSMIIERTQNGKSIAKQREDFKEGRPNKYSIKQVEHALSLLSVNGGTMSYKQVEDVTGISKSTLIRKIKK